ncbi:hypothetical protein QE152_g26058 [Popillia japonica]|uniref:Kazal-like domain-containing protein n=1 Tax=Popillia japonica TaxID=7064 RepID=A0AAW1JZD1_POPJA
MEIERLTETRAAWHSKVVIIQIFAMFTTDDVEEKFSYINMEPCSFILTHYSIKIIHAIIFLFFTALKLNIMKGGIAVTILAVLLCTNIVLARRCPLFCRLVYDPVCAEDSKGNRHTYGSSCSLGLAICFNPGIRFVKRGKC